MLSKSVAVILLALTLSPFNAPFQPVGGTEQQNALIESLSALRHDSDSRATVAQPSPESNHAAVALFVLPVASSTQAAGFGARTGHPAAATGDYVPLTSVLRL